MNIFLEQLSQQTLLDWSITVTALIYIWLITQQNIWCWIWGIISCTLLAYADFARYNYYVDGILQLFYVVMGFWGYYTWKNGKDGDKELIISTLPLMAHFKIIIVGIILTIISGFIFKKYTDTSYPYFDSLITSFSIIATYLAIKKVLENWLYWIIFDSLAVYLFGRKGLVLIAFVMVVYTAVSVVGYVRWRREYLKITQ